MTTSPDFSLPATAETTVSLAALHGRKVVLFFYPKDNTPGCTNEARDFNELLGDFKAAGCEVFGISRDSLRSHENFKAKLGLEYELISDQEEVACEIFGVIKVKNMYGKQARGIERSTFLLDENGQLAREWRGVKVAGHAAEVLAAVQSL
ncbi:MAG: peroxiredoxin [Thauera sp.]|jgi:peroxiredoxin Q/BCP|nr:peroxiredoxin [Thauera sp.]